VGKDKFPSKHFVNVVYRSLQST